MGKNPLGFVLFIDSQAPSGSLLLGARGPAPSEDPPQGQREGLSSPPSARRSPGRRKRQAWHCQEGAEEDGSLQKEGLADQDPCVAMPVWVGQLGEGLGPGDGDWLRHA